MLDLGIKLLIIAHFAFHAIAAIGGVWTFMHSYNSHKKAIWKLIVAVVWFILSVLMIVVEHGTIHSH